MAGRPRAYPLDELEARVAVAAAAEFSARGYEAARIDAIAEASGVSKPVLYRAFGSKSQLYCTLLERGTDELAAAALRSFHAGGDTVVEQLRATIDSWIAVLETRGDEWRMLTTASGADPAIRATVERIRSMQLANDITMIRALVPALPEGEVEPIAEAMRASLIAIGTWWLDHPEVDRTVPVDAMTRICVGLVNAPMGRLGPGARRRARG